MYYMFLLIVKRVFLFKYKFYIFLLLERKREKIREGFGLFQNSMFWPTEKCTESDMFLSGSAWRPCEVRFGCCGSETIMVWKVGLRRRRWTFLNSSDLFYNGDLTFLPFSFSFQTFKIIEKEKEKRKETEKVGGGFENRGRVGTVLDEKKNFWKKKNFLKSKFGLRNAMF